MELIPAVGAAVAALLSGWFYTLTVRLRPVAVAPWLAPLPLLLLAPRVPWSFVAVAAAVERVTVGVLSAIGLATLATWAVRRARSGATGVSAHVGLAAEPGGAVPVSSPEGRRTLESYAQRIEQLAGRGATVVVLPEVAF